MKSGKQDRCPRCGERVYPTDTQCVACGARLEIAEEASAAPAAAGPAAPGGAPGYRVAAGAQPWDPRRVGYDLGFFDRLGRGWAFLKQAVQLLGQDPRLLLPSALAAVAVLLLTSLVAGVLYLTGHWEALGGDSPEGDFLFWVLGVPLMAVSYLTGYFFQGITVNLVHDLLQGRRGDLGAGVRDSLKNLPALALLALASVLVGLAAGAVRGRRGGLARSMAADALQSVWRTAVLLALPIVILEDKPMLAALGRAKDLHGRRLGDVVVAWFGVGLVNQLVGLVVLLPMLAVAVLTYLAGPALLPVAVLVGVVGLLSVSAFAAYLNTAYYTCLYLWAAAAEQAQAPVPAPALLGQLAW